MDVARRVRAPGGVRFAGWMIGIGAFFLCVAGVLLLLVRPDPATLQDAGIGRGVFQAIGFVLLAIGLIEFLLIYALLDGSNTARIVVTVLIGVNALGSLLQALARAPTGVTAWLQLMLDVAILICLWGTPNATEFFRRPAAATPPPPAAPPPPPA
jgi:hypothetical protein